MEPGWTQYSRTRKRGRMGPLGWRYGGFIKGTMVVTVNFTQCHFPLSIWKQVQMKPVPLLKKQGHLLMTPGFGKFFYCLQRRRTGQNPAAYLSAPSEPIPVIYRMSVSSWLKLVARKLVWQASRELCRPRPGRGSEHFQQAK